MDTILFPEFLDGKRLCTNCQQPKKPSQFFSSDSDVCRACAISLNRLIQATVPEGKKYCTKCKDTKDLDAFDAVHTNPEQKHSWCRTCEDACRKRRYREIYTHLSAQDRNLQKNYGITLEDYNVRLEAQNDVCAICNQPEHLLWRGNVINLAVDHDHVTGLLRGLLCGHCNRALGLLEEDLTRIEMMVAYIHKWREIHAKLMEEAS